MDKYVKLINSLWCNGDGIAEETDGLGCANKKCKYRDVDGACDLTNMALDAAAAITDLQAENAEKDKEIERLQAKAKQWKRTLEENFASCEKLQAVLTRVEAERDAAVEENEFRKHTVLTPLYTCGGHGYSEDDDEDFWCPVCRQHLGTHRGFETTCPRCGQEINSDGEPCWDYDEMRRTEYDRLPKNWERGAQGEG